MSATTLRNSNIQTPVVAKQSVFTARRIFMGTLATVAVVTAILYLVTAIQMKSRPFLGVFLTSTLVVNNGQSIAGDTWTGLEAGLARGDFVTGINGRDLFSDPLQPTNYAQAHRLFLEILDTLPRTLDGYEPVTLDFIRPITATTPINPELCTTSENNLAQCSVTFTPTYFSDLDFFAYFGLAFASAVVLISIGFAELRFRMDANEGLIAAAIAFLTAIYAAGIFDVGTTGAITPIWMLSACLLGGTMTTLGITFPKRLRIVRSIPRFEFVPILIGAIVGAIAVFNWFVPTSPWALGLWTQISTLSASIGIILLLVSAMFQRVSANTPRTRDQSNTIFIGTSLLLVPVGFWIVSRIALTQIAEAIPINLEALLPLAIFPNAAIAYAVIQYRHIDTDRAISQGITYTILGGALIIGIFLLSLGGTLITFQFLQARDFITVSLVLFGMVMFFTPVRNQLQERIDSIYFRRRRNLQNRVEDFARRLTSINNYNDITQEFMRVLKDSVSPSAIFIFLSDRTGGEYNAYTSSNSSQAITDIRFASDSQTVKLLAQATDAISLQPGQTWPTELMVDRARLNLLRTSVMVGIRGTNVLNGFVILASPLAKDMYDFDEVRFLENMVGQLSIATERSRVIESLERRVRELDVLSQVGQAVNFTIEFDDLLELIYAQTSKLVPAPYFYIALYEDKINLMYFAFFLEDDDRVSTKEGQRWMLDSGLLAEITRSGSALRVTDFRQEMEKRGASLYLMSDKTRAWMGVPLTAGRRTLGVMAAGKPNDPTPYTDEQFKIFSDIGALAATSLDKANLFTQTRIRERQLTVLNDISRQLVATEYDVEKLLQIIMMSAVEILNGEAGSLLLSTEDGSGDLEFRVVIGGGGADLEGTRIKAGQGIVGRVVESSKPEIVNDAVHDPRHIKEVTENFVSRSLLAVPLIAKDQVIGVLEVINKKDGTPFVEEDSELLTTFAGQAAVAIENARLFQLTDQQLALRVQELETMERLDAQLNRTLELSEVAQITVNQAMTILGCNAGALGIVHMSPPFLEIVAISGYKEEEYPKGAEGMIWPLDEGIVKRVMRSRQADIAMDVAIDPDYDHGLTNSNSQLTIPMMSGDVINSILILEKNTLPRFSLTDWAYAQRLSEHASIAIVNAQFYAALTQANKSRSEFMGFAAHELKNPLASVKGYADVLVSGMTGELSEQQKNFISIIRSNAQRMETIISDLRDAAKVDANEFRVEPEPMNIYSAVVETLRPFMRMLDDKGQELDNKVPENLPLIMGDETRIIQVLTNLISNAHKYSHPNTTITIEAYVDNDYVDRQGKRHGRMVVVGVKDQGLGMSDEDQARLFKERYFRSTNREALEQSGTGLGMTLTYNIMRQHNGDIWIKSKLGEGSTFFISFPLAEDVKKESAAD